MNVTIGIQVGWKATPVCVRCPFFFLATNTSIVRDSLNCFNEKCLLITCWMEYSTTAILMREPAIICMLVVNTTHFYAVSLMAQTHLKAKHWRKEGFWNYSCHYCGHLDHILSFWNIFIPVHFHLAVLCHHPECGVHVNMKLAYVWIFNYLLSALLVQDTESIPSQLFSTRNTVMALSVFRTNESGRNVGTFFNGYREGGM